MKKNQNIREDNEVSTIVEGPHFLKQSDNQSPLTLTSKRHLLTPLLPNQDLLCMLMDI